MLSEQTMAKPAFVKASTTANFVLQEAFDKMGCSEMVKHSKLETTLNDLADRLTVLLMRADELERKEVARQVAQMGISNR